jgi:RNA polymerase sigma-70 factor (ECF subfamily)
MKQNIARRMGFEAYALPQLEGLYRTALYVLDNESDAQDLISTSFARAYYSWLKYQAGPNCRVWLFRIMANALINRYRPSLSLSAAIDGADEIDGHLVYSRMLNQEPTEIPEQIPTSAISNHDVKKTIGNLPDGCRLITVLSLLEGFSYDEIADITGLHVETVRSRLYQGRQLIRESLLTMEPVKAAVG